LLSSSALRESKARLEEAQSIAHVGYWVWSLDTDCVTWSDETYRIFGLKPQKGALAIATVREMIHADDRESVFRTAEAAILGGLRADSEHRLVRPSGEVRTVHSLGTVKRDATGRAYEMFGTVQDITDRKGMEETLRRAQAHFREGQRIARMGSWTSDGSVCEWSEELFAIYGFDSQNGVPSTEEFLAIIYPQDRALMADAIKMMLDLKCGCDVTTRILRSDANSRYVRCVGIPVVEHGEFKGFLGVSMDVTEQELLTQELRREQAYLAEAQRLTHAGSWAVNLVTRQVHHSSDENNRLYGLDVSQDPNPFDRHYGLILAEDEPALATKLENAIRTGTDFDVEFRIRRADGAVRFLRGIGHHNSTQEVGEYVGTTMDITERKRAEEERERLRQLEADLAHINRVNMMGELAAALAHEIKQPIAASVTSANACLRWLAHDPPDLERARAAATRVVEDGHRAADVVNHLRSFYKKDMPPEREKLDIKDVIREMTVLLRTEALRYSITIHSELGAELPSILADRVQLQQVFVNLMLNAIEAMKDGGGELRIESRLNPGGQLMISISDTGVGLPAGNTERIFDAFHTTKPQGTGMGLAITRSIVESHGGRVWATCDRASGATFHFTLPVEAGAQT
jgi:PAS domain S-box-containing protein